MTSPELLALEWVCARGGAVSVGPVDPTNLGLGYEAVVVMATPWKSGCDSYRGTDGASATSALRKALAQINHRS